MGDSAYSRHLRVAGNVQPGSIRRSGTSVNFVLMENDQLLPVVYSGTEAPPDTFKDDSQALADGSFGRDGVFHAKQLQAKCASKYAPKTADPKNVTQVQPRALLRCPTNPQLISRNPHQAGRLRPRLQLFHPLSSSRGFFFHRRGYRFGQTVRTFRCAQRCDLRICRGADLHNSGRQRGGEDHFTARAGGTGAAYQRQRHHPGDYQVARDLSRIWVTWRIRRCYTTN